MTWESRRERAAAARQTKPTTTPLTNYVTSAGRRRSPALFTFAHLRLTHFCPLTPYPLFRPLRLTGTRPTPRRLPWRSERSISRRLPITSLELFNHKPGADQSQAWMS
eukprot:8456512-Pyramimonas_sp.AAC.1